MFTPHADITTLTDKRQQLMQAMKDIAELDVLVGIPEANNTRPGDPVTNAQLAFIHTNGSPIRNIPARPFIEPAIEDDSENISGILAEAMAALLEGNVTEANEKLEKAGMQGQRAAQLWFERPDKNQWPENSPATKARKLKKRATEPQPLIDTDKMRKSITYVIRKKGS